MSARKLKNIEEWLCDDQGELFYQAEREKFDTKDFIEKWMNSKVAEEYDNEIHWTHGMSEAYLFSYLQDVAGKVKKSRNRSPKDALWWIGYMYRYLCICEKISSKEAVARFSPEDMYGFYRAFNCMSMKLALEDILRIYEERQTKKTGKRFAPAMA